MNKMLVGVFNTEPAAHERLSALKDLPSDGDITLYATAVIVGILLCGWSVASADEVFLVDGSKLVGTVQQIAGGNVLIKTEFAGDLTIDQSFVQGITASRPVVVRTATGEQIWGQPSYSPTAGQQLVVEEGAARAMDLSAVSALWPLDQEDPEVVAARPRWSAQFEGGITGDSGNTDRFAGLGALTIKREAPTNRLKVYGLARYTEDDGRVTAREYIGSSRLEVDVTQRLYGYGRVELENDKFEELDLRVIGSAGPGYFIIRQPDHELKVWGGVGYRYEEFTDGTTREGVNGEVGPDYRVELAPWVSFVHSSVFSLLFEDADGWLFKMENALRIPLNEEGTWGLRAGVRNDYDNDPQPGVKGLDTFYFVNLFVDVK